MSKPERLKAILKRRLETLDKDWQEHLPSLKGITMTIDPIILVASPLELPEHIKDALHDWAEDISITNQYRDSVLAGNKSSDEVIASIAQLRDIEPEDVTHALFNVGIQLRSERLHKRRVLK